MHNLLVPFDGSEAALRALQYAIKLAKLGGATSICVVNAQQKATLPADVALHVSDERLEELQREQSGEVLSAVDTILENSGVSYSKEILIGAIAEVIARRAHQHGCDGIVMGTRGMTAIGNLVMGSVATKIVHLAKVPVTLVK